MCGLNSYLQYLRSQVLQQGLKTLTDTEKLLLFTNRPTVHWNITNQTPKVGTC